MVWDKDGAPSQWSEAATFEIGLFGKGDVTAKWIGAKKPCKKGGEPAPMFRKAFTLAREPVKARLHASAFGDLAMSVNGQPASGDLLAPGWTDYRRHVELVTWDVTALLRKGENVLGAMLGQGWYAGFLVWKGHRNQYGASPAFLAQLEVEFADGSRQTVVSDTTWRYTEEGPIRSSDHYMGEDYDARREIPGWDAPGFAAKGWKAAAEITDHPAATLCARLNNGVRRQLELPAKKRTEPAPGVYVFDLGQNMVGLERVTLRGKPGAKISIRFAEMLNPDGTLYTANYRSARSTDTYVCGRAVGASLPDRRESAAGASLPGRDISTKCPPETYEPHFTFHGFRYIELSGDFAVPPECADVTGVVIHTDMARTGRFECSDPLANRLWSNLNWGHVGNYVDVPTDCPQRDERLGWTGDAQVFVRTAAFNRDVAAFMAKWQRDLDDGQRADGAYPDVAPNVLGTQGGHCGWGDAGVICPWTMYLMYGDTGILRDHYGSMSRWVGYWQGVCTPDGVVRYRDIWHYGDWLAVDCPVNEDGNPLCGAAPTPSDLLSTAYFARSVGIMAEVAKALGKKADAKKFAELRRRTAAAYRREFVTPGGRVAGDTQTGYLVTLGFGLVEDKRTITRMVDRLAFLIESRDNALTTGFLGTPLLCPVLARFGRADLAYRILQRRKYPSWYFQILDGDATTMWERWNSYSSKHGFGDVGMNSFNHYAYGAVGEWLYAGVGGIDFAEPGFRRIRFAPVPGGDITWAKASLETRHGTAAIEWRRASATATALDVKALVPPNTTAVLELPGREPVKLPAGPHRLRIPATAKAARQP
ncbi:MAG: family 78 glycoside hydrolase catalytic domain [Kiritimatiellae bacterium]|nr:family 78 glycoside hydrolase catalytic domain [Kiritimatiellia bacterium]